MTRQPSEDETRQRRRARFNHALAMVTSLLLLGLLLAGGIIGIWGLVKMLGRLF